MIVTSLCIYGTWKQKKKTFSSYKWEGGIRTKVFHMKIKSQELLTQKKKKKEATYCME